MKSAEAARVATWTDDRKARGELVRFWKLCLAPVRWLLLVSSPLLVRVFVGETDKFAGGIQIDRLFGGSLSFGRKPAGGRRGGIGRRAGLKIL